MPANFAASGPTRNNTRKRPTTKKFLKNCGSGEDEKFILPVENLFSGTIFRISFARGGGIIFGSV